MCFIFVLYFCVVFFVLNLSVVYFVLYFCVVFFVLYYRVIYFVLYFLYCVILSCCCYPSHRPFRCV